MRPRVRFVAFPTGPVHRVGRCEGCGERRYLFHGLEVEGWSGGPVPFWRLEVCTPTCRDVVVQELRLEGWNVSYRTAYPAPVAGRGARA